MRVYSRGYSSEGSRHIVKLALVLIAEVNVTITAKLPNYNMNTSTERKTQLKTDHNVPASIDQLPKPETGRPVIHCPDAYKAPYPKPAPVFGL